MRFSWSVVALASRLVGNVRAVADTDSLMDAGMLLPILCLFKCTDNLQILRKRGIFQTGGFPIELPAISLAEPIVKPTTMLYRNFLSMETEELLRSHPVDACVLMGGCDKTTPGLLMGAISMDLPTIFFPAGPMLRGNWKGKPLGSGSDSWKY